MKICKNLEDFNAIMPKAVKDDYQEVLRSYPEWEFEHSEEKDKLFESYLGGYVYLIESLNEIKEIETSKFHPTEDRFFNLSECSDIFDICEWMPNNEFVQVVKITNDSGGDSYIIPRHLALQHRFLIDSILDTNYLKEDSINVD